MSEDGKDIDGSTAQPYTFPGAEARRDSQIDGHPTIGVEGY